MARYKEDIITGLVIMITFLFFVLTPGRDSLGSAIQGFIIAFIFFGLLPLGYHFLILKKSLVDFALAAGAWRTRIPLMVPVIVGTLLITTLCYWYFPGFRAGFMLPGVVQESFGWFVGYELVLVPLLLAFYEIFFRGFIQKSWLEKYFGWRAIVVQSLLFGIFLFATASLGWATFPLLLVSLGSGILVRYNHSLIQAWLSAWLSLLLFDVFLLIIS